MIRNRPRARNDSLGAIANDSQLDQFWPKPLKRLAFCRGRIDFSTGSASRSRAACSLHQSRGLASGWAVSSLTWARREPSVPGLFRCRGRLPSTDNAAGSGPEIAATVQEYPDIMLPAAKGLRGTSRGLRGVVDDSHRRRAPCTDLTSSQVRTRFLRTVDCREASKSLEICRLPGEAPAIVFRTVPSVW